MAGRGSNSRRWSARNALGLFAFLATCIAVASLGGAVTATSVDNWYQTLDKPAFTPPEWVFAPVWSSLYILMAIAAWRVWLQTGSELRRIGLILFAAQLGLNLFWSILFFGLHRIGFALFEIVTLVCTIIATTYLFWKIDRVAGALLTPYLIWVSYASVLNASLWHLNRV